MTAFAGVGHADTPSPTPSTTTTPAAPTPTASATAAPPAPPTATPSATRAVSPSPSEASPSRRVEPSTRRAARAPGLTLDVRPSSGTVFWSDIGAFAIRGSAPGFTDKSPVEVFRRAGTGPWTKVAGARTAGQAYAVDVPVLERGSYTFVTTTGGAPDKPGVAASNSVPVTVGDSRVTLDRPVAQLDTLKDPRLSGSIVPARAGVTIHIDRQQNGRYSRIAAARTDANGRFALNFSHGRGSLLGYRLRAAYRVPNRAHWEVSSSHHLERVAVLNAVVTPTTAAEVAKTYRAGCPVGRSKLSTVRMNYYGSDKKMHRGVLIIRTDLAGEIKYAFGRSVTARFPIARMQNPNDYGGNDPQQMRADNTSGFNCRSVVGNPYRRSPHSYGTALDINPRQNPFRDVTGKWWPENGRGYIDRTPRRGGMLSLGSTLTKTLRSDGFFWGGLWSPGRDYQHFQY